MADPLGGVDVVLLDLFGPEVAPDDFFVFDMPLVDPDFSVELGDSVVEWPGLFVVMADGSSIGFE